MSKLIYMLTICMMAFSFSAFAEEECEEGQVFDPEFGFCIDAPEEAPVEEGSPEELPVEEAPME